MKLEIENYIDHLQGCSTEKCGDMPCNCGLIEHINNIKDAVKISQGSATIINRLKADNKALLEAIKDLQTDLNAACSYIATINAQPIWKADIKKAEQVISQAEKVEL